MECQFVVTYHVEEHAGRPTPVTYAELFEQVATAEQVGFDALWLAEHHFGAQQGVASQPLLVALAAAERTPRIAVGTSLLVLPLHHPLALAEQLATLDALLGDRLSIGFGSGSAEFEFAGFDVDFAAPARHARFRESLDLLERAWSGGTFDFAGEVFRVPGARLVPAPMRPLRDFAWIGAMSEATAATAGEFGYGLQLPRGRAAADYTGVLEAYRGAHRAARAAHGWAPETERVAIARCVYVGADDESALCEAGPSIVRFYETSKGYDPSKPTPSAAELLEQLHFVVGGPERCARQLTDLREATGLTHLSMQPNWIDLPHDRALASLRRFGEQVIPRLR
jgi:alkanesulfonate monooxygenase SsuD/methylene tetrahydromethanopterin reductase-like flavin-dependent oxidoreductase (luciferase family)